MPIAVPDTPVDILLVGLGAIGSVYAYMLEKSGKARITAVARSNYNIYAGPGVTLDTTKFGKIEGWRPSRLFRSQAEALADGTHYTFCLVATKCLPDVLPTPVLLADAIASGQIGAWSLIQNGLGVEEDLYKAVDGLNTPVISSLAWMGVVPSADGSIITWKGPEVLCSGVYNETLGKMTIRATLALDQWVELVTSGGGVVKTTDNINAVRYSKNVINCAWSSMQGLARTLPSSWYEFPSEIVQPMKDFIREVVDVGFDSGLLKVGMVQCPDLVPMGDREEVAAHCWSKVIERSWERKHHGGGHRMSLWVDVEMGRPFELEVIVASVYKLARKLGKETPRLDLVYALLKGLQAHLVEQRDVQASAAKSAAVKAAVAV